MPDPANAPSIYKLAEPEPESPLEPGQGLSEEVGAGGSESNPKAKTKPKAARAAAPKPAPEPKTDNPKADRPKEEKMSPKLVMGRKTKTAKKPAKPTAKGRGRRKASKAGRPKKSVKKATKKSAKPTAEGLGRRKASTPKKRGAATQKKASGRLKGTEGVVGGRRSYSPEQKEKLLAEYHDLKAGGMTAVKAAKKVGVTYVTLLKWEKGSGGATRTTKTSTQRRARGTVKGTERGRRPGRPKGSASPKGNLVLVTPDGNRIEGISPNDLIRVLKALR